MNGNLRLVVVGLAGVVLASGLRGEEPKKQTRSPKAIAGGEKRFWKESPDQAKVLAATFLGGKGHEWLAAGGFQADGTIVLAGNTLSPFLDLGVPAEVIGEDAPPPPEPQRVPVSDGRGGQRKDREGHLLWEPPSWRHAGATGFVVHCSPDLARILAVHRLPWTAGAITSAVVNPDGTIYIAGRATEQIAKLGGQQEEAKVEADTKGGGGCDQTFIAKLSPDGRKCEWVRRLRGPSNAPLLTLLKDGNLKLAAPDLRTYDRQGKLVASATVPGGLGERSAVNPVDGTFAKGGDYNTGTGREPWRCPYLGIYRPDGSYLYQLYEWPSGYVGLDNCRQVSDSAVRHITYDDEGNMLIVSWSDGGNSVMVSPPTDVRRGHGQRGLGWTTAGAGVLSCQYLIRIEPKDYKVTGATLWLSFYHGKPNSTEINTLGFAADGSVCFGGGSAWGLIQTKNTLNPEGEPAGSHVAVLSKDMSSLRFCSTLAGAGEEVQVGQGNWGIATGMVKGQPRVLFLTGAVKEKDVYGWVSQTPSVNAVQKDFGGGWLDGYALLLDLSAGAEPGAKPGAEPGAKPGAEPGAKPGAEAQPAEPLDVQLARAAGVELVPSRWDGPESDAIPPGWHQAGRRPAPVEDVDAGTPNTGGPRAPLGLCLAILAAGLALSLWSLRGGGRGRWGAAVILFATAALALACGVLPVLAGPKAPRPLPDAGTVFHFTPSYPKYATVDVEFRDPTDKMWPNFSCGKPVEGTYTFDPTDPKVNFTVKCDRWCQPKGDQSRRILGELVKDAKGPDVKFTLTAIGPKKTEEIVTKNARGEEQKRTEEFHMGEGLLDIGGIQAKVQPRCTVWFGYGSGSDKPERVYVKAKFVLKGADLGLKAPGAQGEIAVRVEMAGTLAKEPPPRKKG